LPRLPSHSFAIFVIASFAIPTPQPIYVTTSRQSGIRFWTVQQFFIKEFLKLYIYSK
jgi:hypothetical protein